LKLAFHLMPATLNSSREQSPSFKEINCNTDVQAERSKMEQFQNYMRLTQTSCQVVDFL